MSKNVKKQGRVKTAELLQRIFTTRNVRNFIAKNSEHLKLPTLAEHLSELCAKKNIKPREVVKNADIDRIYGAELFSGRRRNPSRDYIIRLAFGYGLNYKECQRLLTVAGKNLLYARVPRDVVIINCLHNKMNFQQAELSLHEMGFSTLGGLKP